jgi:hypothetical protein
LASSSQLILAKFRITILYDPGLGMFVNILVNLQVGLVWQIHTAFLTTIYLHIDFFFEPACKFYGSVRIKIISRSFLYAPV